MAQPTPAGPTPYATRAYRSTRRPSLIVPTARIDFNWKLQDWNTATAPQVICEIEADEIACSIYFYSRHHQDNDGPTDCFVATIHSTKYPENHKFRNSENFSITSPQDDLAKVRYWLFEEVQYLRREVKEFEQRNRGAMALFQALVEGKV